MDQAYPPRQINALISLLAQLSGELPSLALITGHQQLDTKWVPASDDPKQSVRRKLDPGPRFPWSRILEETPLSWFEPGD